MPDWSYRPLFAPWMLRYPALSHALVLTVMRCLGRYALLYRIIDWLGHMRPSPALRRQFAGLSLSSPLGLSAVIDRSGRAFRAFERFGYGYVETGPLTLTGPGKPGKSSVDIAQRALTGPAGQIPLDEFLAEVRRQPSRLAVHRLARIAPDSSDQSDTAFTTLAPHVAGFLVGKEHAAHVAKIGKPWGLVVRLSQVPALSEIYGAPLIVIDPDDGVWSPADRSRGLSAVAELRERFRDASILYAAGGIESPQHARAFLDAGADLISLSHGFVFTGPGTPKRVNEAIAVSARNVEEETPAPETLVESARYAWFWCLLLGMAMTLGAILAGYFAVTRVILPYDEAAAGITPDLIASLNPKLLQFMAHDRFTLAGTMLSLGLFYAGLAGCGVRRGRIWAQETVVFSAFGGFLTFFTFLAYGYFDQFHAFVAASMLPIAIQCAVARPVTLWARPTPDLENDAAWRRACIGQTCWVIQSIGLLLAGLTIMFVGSSGVFVESDLAFLGASRDSLRLLHPNLVPLIAHDRATFGGMLLASGIGMLTTTLWGFRRGERWLWWTFGLAGFPAYFAALWIHHDIAYTDHFHLSPVFIGLALHIAGWALSAGYLRDRSTNEASQTHS